MESEPAPPGSCSIVRSDATLGTDAMAGPTPHRSDALREGAVIAGRYRVEEVLGRGGMGLVLAATHLGLGQRVAIKVVLPSGLLVAGAVERFEREARAAAALRTDHVVKVSDFGRLESGAPFLVMEHLEGADLGRVLEQRGRLPVSEAVDLVLQATEAIAEAHAQGIVHRDLKPPNLFLVNRQRAAPILKVLDFGLSKMRADGVSSESLTGAHLVAGSPHYMSPEQVRSLKAADARTDVWALGVVLFELLTGRRPFEGPTTPAVLVAVTTDAPPTPRSICPEVPLALEAVILRCLEKSLERRVQTAIELARLLAPFASRRGRAAVEQLLDAPETSGAPVAPAPEPAAVPVGPSSDSMSGESIDSSAVTTIPRLPRESNPGVDPNDVALVSTDPAPQPPAKVAVLETLPSPAADDAPPNPVLVTLPMAQPPIRGGPQGGSPPAQQSTLVSAGGPPPRPGVAETVLSTPPMQFASPGVEPRTPERGIVPGGRPSREPAPLPPPPPPAWAPERAAFSPANSPPFVAPTLAQKPVRAEMPVRAGVPVRAEVPARAEMPVRAEVPPVRAEIPVRAEALRGVGQGIPGGVGAPRRKWQWWILGGAGVGLLVGLGAAAVVRSGRADPAATASSAGATGAGAPSRGVSGDVTNPAQDTPSVGRIVSSAPPLVEPARAAGPGASSTPTGVGGGAVSTPKLSSPPAGVPTPSVKSSGKTAPPIKVYK